MSLLRVLAPLSQEPTRCAWALVEEGRSSSGDGPIAQLPKSAQRVQLVIRAGDVLIARAALPRGARRQTGAVLAFAVEEATAAEPDDNQVSWLGKAGEADVLAVLDRQGVERWTDALAAAGLRAHEVHCEILFLPRAEGEWSLRWDGHEGFVRSGEFEGAATDGGGRATPPLVLSMMLEQGPKPSAIAIYGEAPDLAQWQAALGVPLRFAGASDWRTARENAGVRLPQARRRWQLAPGLLASLRPAAWIAGAALAVHGLALALDWTRLASEQRGLRAQMEARFRGAFPDAVAVADPGLQMRRQLALARHRIGVADSGDFAPMIEKVAGALKDLAPRGLRTVSYESGRMTLELAALDDAALRRLAARLAQAGLVIDVAAKNVISVHAS